MEQQELWYKAGEKALEFLNELKPEVVVFGAGRTVCEALKAYHKSGFAYPVVCASLGSQREAEKLGMETIDKEKIYGREFVYIDGTDQIDPQNNLIKGGLKVTPNGFTSSGDPGLEGCMKKEKYLAGRSSHFIVIADGSKVVDYLGANGYILPVEFEPSKLRDVEWRVFECTENRGIRINSNVRKKPDGSPFVTENGNHILDSQFDGRKFGNLASLERMIENIPGVVSTGLFAIKKPEIVIIAKEDEIFVRRP